MAEQQLWLFPQPKPLRERFGDGFFKNVPAEPGVYVMRDARDRVVYVGQSKNLRRRLCSYKNVRPERDARKLVRLVHCVDKITWETCLSAEQARVRENELLRRFRPRFNRVNTHPEAYGFIGMRSNASELELWLTQQASTDEELYGAFKGHRLAGYGAVLRLLLRVLAGCSEPEQFPQGFLGVKPPRRYRFDLVNQGTALVNVNLSQVVREYLQGRSAELVDWCEAVLPKPTALSSFWQALHALDLQVARDFFERGPKRNWQLRERYGIQARTIAPAALDDLVAISATPRVTSARAESGSAS